MPGKLLYEYAVIRIVPRVERGEFLNTGVVLYCAAQKFLEAMFTINEPRLLACCAHIDLHEVACRLQAYEKICRGHAGGGPIAQLPPASRFRWLTASKSTILQTSPVHPGFCEHPAAELQRLFENLVL